MSIKAETGKKITIARGKLSFNTSGAGDITLEITLSGGQGASTSTVTAPDSYVDELPDCIIVPTIPVGTTLDIDYIEKY